MCEAAAPEVSSPDLEMLADLARRAGEDAPARTFEELAAKAAGREGARG